MRGALSPRVPLILTPLVSASANRSRGEDPELRKSRKPRQGELVFRWRTLFWARELRKGRVSVLGFRDRKLALRLHGLLSVQARGFGIGFYRSGCRGLRV